MPKVSVIVPVYGVEKYIERCAESLFLQTLDDIEYIFIDDCTPDSSIELLKNVIEKYQLRLLKDNKIVRIVKMSSNSGLPAVRRHGIQLATGDFLIHCDSDDWVEIDMYEKLYKSAISNKSDIVFCDYFRSNGVNSNSFRGINISYSEQKSLVETILSYQCSTALWNKLVKRSLYFHQIRYPNDNMWEDYVITSQLCYYAKSYSYVDEPLYYYYYNPNSICYSNIDVRQNQILNNCNLILDFFKEKLPNLSVYLIDVLKLTSRNELVLLTGQSKYLKLWRNTYPEINRRIIFNPYISYKNKIKQVLIYCGIYPLLRTIKNHYVL